MDDLRQYNDPRLNRPAQAGARPKSIWTPIVILAAAVVLALTGYAGWNYYTNLKNDNYLDQGWNYIDAGEYEKAFSAFDKLLEQGPSASAFFGKGTAHYRLKEYEKAVEQLEHANQWQPGNPSILERIGVSYYRLGQYEKSLTYFDLLHDINSTRQNTLYFRSMALLRLGRYDESLASFEQLKELNPNKQYLNFGLGMCYLRLNMTEAAFESFNRELSNDNQSAYSRMGLSIYHRQTGNEELARKEFYDAVKLDPVVLQDNLFEGLNTNNK